MAYTFDEHKYQQKIKSGGTKFGVVILIILILLGAAIFLTPKKNNSVYFYFVQMGEYQNYNDANSLANEIISKQGAGYIYFDGSYHVLANFYYQKSDAQKVCENLKINYPTCKVFALELKNLSTIKHNKILTNFYDDGMDFFRQLSLSNIKFDTNENSLRAYSTNIKILSDKFNESADKFSENFLDKKHYNILSNLEKIRECLDGFDAVLSSSNIKQQMKFYTCEIAIKFYQILAEF